MRYLLDADTLNYVPKAIPPTSNRFLEAMKADAEFVRSPVVHYQVTRYLKLKQASRMLDFYEKLVADWLKVELRWEDWDQASDLWAVRHRVGRGVENTDLLIAVTALGVGATLVTNNTRHFQGLGLTLENWTTP